MRVAVGAVSIIGAAIVRGECLNKAVAAERQALRLQAGEPDGAGSCCQRDNSPCARPGPAGFAARSAAESSAIQVAPLFFRRRRIFPDTGRLFFRPGQVQ